MKSVLATGMWATGHAVGAARDNAPSRQTLEQQVADTERAFARTMAERDHAAFTRLLAADAVFFGATQVSRGREAVAAAWKRFFETPAAPFSWRPERVQVLDSGSLGFSTGPVFDPAGTRVGTFNSVWRREPDGSWRIVFDSGCPPCECP
jgi:ketosteroid isomerase-like protein